MNHKEIKTGRNLPLATAVSLGLALTLITSLWFDRWVFAFLVALVAYFAMREMFPLLDISDISIQYLLYLTSILFPLLTYAGDISQTLPLVFPVVFLGVLLILRSGYENFSHKLGTLLLSILYIAVLLSFMVDLARYDNGFQLVFSLALLNSAVDTGGYFAGILFGKRPLFKTLSPKKTIEGLFGSIVLTALIAVAVIPQLISLVLWQSALLAATAVLFGVVGDLFESALKRERGVKDASDAIPGHGGVLDRIDALLFNAPIVWFMFIVVFEAGIL
ncbi:MAG: phosphatidate cytidylyltransferase [Candidatus Nanopelagicales bacterium]